MNDLGLKVISRIANNNKIWNFSAKEKTLNAIYEKYKKRESPFHFFSYNIVSYINRVNHEPKILGGLFADLECEFHTLAIAMEAFIQIMEKIAKIDEIVKRKEDLDIIIATLRSTTANLFGFRCES